MSPDRRTALGHRRLSIVGVENGRQPIASEDETVHVVVNGEFYDYRGIVQDLEGKGHHFRTRSDSEIAVHLYEEYGLDFVHHLRGEFALVLWDERRRRLVAARDRFGIKPLLYAVTEGAIVIASEAKALFASGVDPEWDCESFFQAASMQYVQPDRTLFAGVNQVPPGSTLIVNDTDHAVDRGDIHVRRYWQIPVNSIDSQGKEIAQHCGAAEGRGAAELIAECRRQIVDATTVRLHGDVPVCFQLSGGLDSSAVLAVAAEALGRPLDAYTVTFDQVAYDESRFAQEAASHVGARRHSVHITPTDVLANLADAVGMSEGLCINGHLSAKHLLHRRIRDDGFKVVLTGEGADEAFAGYGHLRIDHWRTTGREQLISNLSTTNRTSVGMMLAHGQWLDLSGVEKRLGFVPAWMEAKATLGYRLRPLLCEEFLSVYADRDPYGEFVDVVVHGEPSRNRVDQSTLLWTKSALANYILQTLGDGTEMANSVEGRVPFLDHHLWEFLARVPTSLKIRDATEKYILREATRDYLPSSIYRREKHPFDVPPVSLIADPSCWELVVDTLHSEAFRTQPFFDTQRTIERLSQLTTDDDATRLAWDPIVMTVLSTIAMQDKLISK